MGGSTSQYEKAKDSEPEEDDIDIQKAKNKREESRNPSEEAVHWAERLEIKKDEAIKIICDIVEKGNLISELTNKPLSDAEKRIYLNGATFYLEQSEKEHYKTEGNAFVLPPEFETILRLKRFAEPHLIAHVETICQIPVRHNKKAYDAWCRKIREKIMPEGDEPLKEEFLARVFGEHGVLAKFVGTLSNGGLTNLVGYLGGAGGIGTISKSVIQNAMDEVALVVNGSVASQSYHIGTGAMATGVAGLAYMGGVVAWNLYKVSKGRSWRRCGKNIVDELGCATAGSVMGFAATVISSFFLGPLSLLVGVGVGIASSLIARPVVQKFTCEKFNLPDSETLEKAHLAIGVPVNAKDDDLGREYRKKSRMYHPDKFSSRNPMASEKQRDNNHREFLKVQAAIDMIRAFREDNTVEYENAKINFIKIQEELEGPRLGVGEGINQRLRLMIESIRRRIPFEYLKVKKLNFPSIGYGVLPYGLFEENPDLGETDTADLPSL